MGTPVTHDEMIQMFASNQDATLEIIRSMQTAVNATTKAETDKIDIKLDGVITRQNKVNNSVAKNIKAAAKNTEVTKKISKWMRHWKWCLAGLFVFCYGVAWVYENIDLKETIVNIISNL